MKIDSLHYDFREIDGYDKTFNFIVSEREAGKTTAGILKKCVSAWKSGFTSLILKRNVVDVTDIFINDMGAVIEKFKDDPSINIEEVNLKYKLSSIKDGIVDVYLNEKLFVRIIALSIKISRFKSLLLKNVKYLLFDEFICNMRLGEKYLKGEAFKFKELYKTFNRENKDRRIKCYFLGNPYSLFNPYFVEFGIDTNKLKRGEVYAKNDCLVQLYELKPELKEFILKNDPLYNFDDLYSKYAFSGENINDKNIQILENVPNNFAREYIFRIDNKLIGIYRGQIASNSNLFYCKFENNYNKETFAFCFEFSQLQDRTILLDNAMKMKFHYYKRAFQNREVYFQNIECYYLCEEIYLNL